LKSPIQKCEAAETDFLSAVAIGAATGASTGALSH